MLTMRHEIPTHLDVEDRVLAGLSMRQALLVLCGLTVAYGFWAQRPDLPPGMRALLATACTVIAVVVALLRPGGRGLEAWALLAVRYAIAPKVRVWRPSGADPAPDGDDQRWADYRPVVAWTTPDVIAEEALP